MLDLIEQPFTMNVLEYLFACERNRTVDFDFDLGSDVLSTSVVSM